VSYIGLRGKCRYCHSPISPQYIITELVTAGTFVLSFIYLFGWSAERFTLNIWSIVSLLFVWSMVATLIALFIYDLRWGYLPDIWTLGGSAVGLSVAIVATLFRQPLIWQPHVSSQFSVLSSQPADGRQFLATIASGVVAMGFFYLIVWGSEKILHKPGMGLGDVKLALLMGIFLGFPGIVVAIYLAFILGAVLSLLLLAAKQKSFGQAIPFGPFLIAGTLLAWWITPLVANWYQLL
jgi:leader peptidase (prepilin peptidase)/N-methyltransferase